jgi:hypothetical protein
MTVLSVVAMASLAFVSVNALRQSPPLASRPIPRPGPPVAQRPIMVPGFSGIDDRTPPRPGDLASRATPASRSAPVSRKPIPGRAAKTQVGNGQAVTTPVPVAAPPQPVRKQPGAKPPSLPPAGSRQRAAARERPAPRSWGQVADVADEVWAAFVDLLRA